MAFVKGGLALRNAYNTYKSCLKFVQKLEKEGKLANHPTVNDHFISGVYFGMGTFNLVLSLFPAKLIKVSIAAISVFVFFPLLSKPAQPFFFLSSP